MRMTDVSATLSSFDHDKFNPTTKKIFLQKGKIDVTIESIHKILGFSLGRTNILKLSFRIKDNNPNEE